MTYSLIQTLCTVLFFAFILSFVLTGFLRQYALKQAVMDIPSQRSAHTHPTPRGGGVSFILVLLITVPCLNVLGFLTPQGSLALIAAAFFVGLLGFLDDHGYLNIGWRLLGHAIAAILALYWMQGFPTIELWGWHTPHHAIMLIIGFFYMIWMVNLYNFMDGIDGLAASEAICVCCCIALIDAWCGDPGLMILPLVLAFSVLGFLMWNWPPARIFMGDAGSGFLGLMMAVLSLQATALHPQLFWSWMIILGVFIVDATYTLLYRACAGEKIYEAHANHAYQRAARRLGSHFRVTMMVILVNIVWLSPLAILVGLRQLEGIVGLIIAYTPLILGVMVLRAGQK